MKRSIVAFLIFLSLFTKAQQKSLVGSLIDQEAEWHNSYLKAYDLFIEENYIEAEAVLLGMYNQVIYQKNLRKSSKFISVCDMLIRVYLEAEMHKEAEDFCLRNIDLIVNQQVFSEHLVSFYGYLGNILFAQKRAYEATEFLRKFIQSRVKFIGKNILKNDKELLELFYELTTLHLKFGNYQKVDSLIQFEAIPIINELCVSQKDKQEYYGTYYLLLSSSSFNEGLIAKSELYLKESEKFKTSKYVKKLIESQKIAIWVCQGKYKEVEQICSTLKNIKKNNIKNPSIEIANFLNLATALIGQKKYQEAIFSLRFLINTYRRYMVKAQYVTALINLGYSYKELKVFSEAEKLYKEAIQKNENNDKYKSIIYNNLGEVYMKQEKYALAKYYYILSLNLKEKVLPKTHFYYLQSYLNLASNYFYQKNIDSAFVYYQYASNCILQNIDKNFFSLSENDKLKYADTFRDSFEQFFSFALQTKAPQLNTWLFDNILIYKGLLLVSTTQFRRNIEKSNNKELLEIYQKWIEKLQELTKLYEKVINKHSKIIDEIERVKKQANDLEKELSIEANKVGISFELTKNLNTWDNIKQNLKEKEAYVDITRIRYYDKEWTDSILYVALVIKKNSNLPEMIVFPNGKKMEGEDIEYYRNSINFRKQESQSFKVFFEPLKSSLNDVNKLYFSGDGVYHQINLSTLFNPISQKYLDEEIFIELHNSPKSFLNIDKKQTPNNQYLYLFGFPNYEKQAKSTNSISLAENYPVTIDKRQLLFYQSKIAPLPGTKIEVENIYQIAHKAGIETKKYIDIEASEENLKNIKSAYILHIATHGFFNETRQDKINTNLPQNQIFLENPLTNSGLLLTGAELSLEDKKMKAKENGIFTAQEATTLNLQNTDLVVLSACETGLGKIRNGEGVYGLQRAFLLAGAKSVVMSLWKVDDIATQEIMSLFYENMLIKKQNKRMALYNAQSEIKKKYKSPYYWGAFIIIGE